MTILNAAEVAKTNDPVIWKKESCLRGECEGERIVHWWSIPFTAPMGLVTECYHCGKTKEVKTNG